MLDGWIFVLARDPFIYPAIRADMPSVRVMRTDRLAEAGLPALRVFYTVEETSVTLRFVEMVDLADEED